MITKKNIRGTILLICIVLVCRYGIFPQTNVVQFEHYSLDAGLSQNTVYSVVQDEKGFLWLGTADGLNRYDGYEFKVFRNDPNDAASLSANRVYVIFQDSNNNLWIGTYGGGLDKYDRVTESFYHFKHNDKNKSSLNDDEILTIYEDHSHQLWIGTDGGGLDKFDYTNNTFKHYKNNPDNDGSISNNEVQAIYEDHLGYLWVGTRGGGLNKFETEKDNFIHYKNDPNDFKSLSDDEVLSICEDSYKNLWVGTGSGGLNKFNRSNGTFVSYKNNPGKPNSISANRIYAIIEDKSYNLWIGTMGGGLNKYLRESNSFISYKFKSDNARSLSSDGIFSLYEDKTGILWISTYGGGVNKLDRSKEQFRLYRNEPDNPNTLSNNGIFSFCEDKFGDLWIGTSDGLNRLDRKTKKYFVYRNNPANPGSISGNEILSIYEDSKGNLWIGTFGGGLNLFDRENNKFIHFVENPVDPMSLSDNKVFAIYEDKFGNLWAGTYEGGLNKFNREKKQFIHYKNNPDDPTSLSVNRIFSIYEDRKGDLWIGTDSGGLNKFNEKQNNFTVYKNKADDPSSLSNDGILSIYESKAGDLWIGTHGGGLNKFIRSKEKFEHFRTEDGLPNNVVYGILEDDHGNLWLTTNNGLSRFNPKTNTFRNYDMNDGLQGNEFNQGAFCKSKTGDMIFGGPNGYNVFHPDSIKSNKFIPQIAITNFQLLHKSVSIGYDKQLDRTILEKSISETVEIELNHDDNVISFEFTALDYWGPDKNKYAYFLEGFDEDWTYTDANRRFVTYTNLDAGKYIFRVKGSNNDGVWNETGRSIELIIKPPWWATWWSYSIYSAIIIILMIAVRQYDLRRQRLRHQLKLEHEHTAKLEEIDRIKSRFFTNISHEFRTPLTLILGPAERIISESRDAEAGKHAGIIKRNASRLLDLINQLLDLSKLESGKLKLEASLTNLSTFVKGITMSFESLAEKKDIEIRLSMENPNIEAYFDTDKMQKILTNTLSNAFKFTHEGGKVEVSLSETGNNSAIIKIKDTGIGISSEDLRKIFDMFYQADGSSTREQQGSGIGLALTKELVELHRGRIYINSKEGEGTEVIIEIPLGREHLKDEEIIDSDEKQFVGKEISDREYFTEKGEEPDSEIIESEKNIILVVEDNAEVRDYIKDSLIREFDVVEAINGEQGLRKAEKYIPDLIVGDIMMPKMDGYEMTKRIKQDEKTSHIPIILLTAKSDKESKLEGLELGADDYLTKPFDTKELLARMRNLIETRKLLQEKFSAGTLEIKIKGKQILSAIDGKFVEKVLSVVNKHIAEEEFSIEDISLEVGMSRAQIYRKIKALTGKSPSVYLRSIRLSKAQQLIKEKKGTIAEISYWVGFSSPTYFSRCFKEEFGYPPSERQK